ncbi:hypothetical protein LAZ67_17002463 [Cordylochernes scorpioides]|uniref:Transposase n=1 Tax=Cordylochernes scorpioides TaxID=51811 RepID=A0ABY6LIU7_9ARAC|nr:hypothetical protein LAZ67_17002463 [Cordylochernes scorpioides]
MLRSVWVVCLLGLLAFSAAKPLKGPDNCKAKVGNLIVDLSALDTTISRRLVANGLHSCRPLRRLPLTPPNRRQRLEWCRARSTWMTEWHRVVFSDESRFCLSSDSRRVRVWRRRGERSNPAAIVERPTVRQRGIMVWGAIAYDSRSPLFRIQGTMTAQRYVDDVLRPVTLPYLQGVPNALYQQDNARPHTARISQQALQDVQMLPWPPCSPDLSPIEHVWDIIGRRLHALLQPRLEDELWQMDSVSLPPVSVNNSANNTVEETSYWPTVIIVLVVIALIVLVVIVAVPKLRRRVFRNERYPDSSNVVGRVSFTRKFYCIYYLSVSVNNSANNQAEETSYWPTVIIVLVVIALIVLVVIVAVPKLRRRVFRNERYPDPSNVVGRHRMNIANEMLDSVRDDPNLLQRVITGDEAWVYGYDVETKAQSSQWKLPHEPRPKKARQVRSNVKVLLTVFFDCRGVVHHEFLPQSRTVNKEYYLQVMRNLREAIRQKRPDLWKNKN